MQDDRLGPVAESERLTLVDALRGFALLGIVLVNVAGFSHPFQTFLLPFDATLPASDLIARVGVAVFAEGKFYTLFSTLFGLGLAIQSQRARARDLPWRLRYVRRLLILFGIGAVHGTLIWAGDILMLYALVGFALIVFAGIAPRTLLAWVLVLAAFIVLTTSASFAVLEVVSPTSEMSSVVIDDAQLDQEIAEAYRVYATGSFAEITAQRLQDLQFWVDQSIAQVPMVLLYFLLGLYLGKRNILHRPDEHATLFRRWLLAGLLFGLPLSVLYAATRFVVDPSQVGRIDWLSFLTFFGGGLALSLAYIGAFCLLWLRTSARPMLVLLAPVGRMALTNYLLQSVIATFVFYGYGLGLFGQITTTEGIVIAFTIYAFQIPLSHWWLARFRFGPMEWLWRGLTYWRLQPMRR